MRKVKRRRKTLVGWMYPTRIEFYYNRLLHKEEESVFDLTLHKHEQNWHNAKKVRITIEEI